jgi:hypothetical protein
MSYHFSALLSGALQNRGMQLPPTNTKRWVTSRKAEVVAAVRDGHITLEEACARYHLSLEEFQSWERLLESHGVRGLRTTRLQLYRDQPPRRAAGQARAR